MGCMQKVFDVEIDLDLLGELEARRDGFGAVKARRDPLPMCHSESRRATSTASTRSAAGTRSSSRFPLASPSFRVFAQIARLTSGLARFGRRRRPFAYSARSSFSSPA